MEKILVICAHPDDETLGLGGTISLHSKNGDKVNVLILTDGESAGTKSKKKILLRRKQSEKACSILGIKNVEFLNYPDQKLDTISLANLSHDIEIMIRKYAPSIIYTHFWGDMNQDHRITFDATQIAIRPIKKPIIKKLLCFETPSSTEWGLGKTPFHPNTFVDISKSIKKKIEAMEKYEHEVEPFPHPRSKKSILSRSNYWGTFIGMENVEPFMLMRELSNLNSI